MILTRIKI